MEADRAPAHNPPREDPAVFAEVLRERLANVRDQRDMMPQSPLARTTISAARHWRSASSERHDLAGAQSEARKQEQDRGVAPAARRMAVAQPGCIPMMELLVRHGAGTHLPEASRSCGEKRLPAREAAASPRAYDRRDSRVDPLVASEDERVAAIRACNHASIST